jgi:hypothetical protein
MCRKKNNVDEGGPRQAGLKKTRVEQKYNSRGILKIEVKDGKKVYSTGHRYVKKGSKSYVEVDTGHESTGNANATNGTLQTSSGISGSAASCTGSEKKKGPMDDYVFEIDPKFKAETNDLVAEFFFQTGILFQVNISFHQTVTTKQGCDYRRFYPKSIKSAMTFVNQYRYRLVSKKS